MIIVSLLSIYPGLPWWLSGRESICQHRRCGFDSWVRKMPWRRAWQPTPVFLPGESCGQRSLVDFSSLWGLKRVGHISVTKQTASFSPFLLPSLPPSSPHPLHPSLSSASLPTSFAAPFLSFPYLPSSVLLLCLKPKL